MSMQTRWVVEQIDVRMLAGRIPKAVGDEGEVAHFAAIEAQVERILGVCVAAKSATREAAQRAQNAAQAHATEARDAWAKTVLELREQPAGSLLSGFAVLLAVGFQLGEIALTHDALAFLFDLTRRPMLSWSFATAVVLACAIAAKVLFGILLEPLKWAEDQTRRAEAHGGDCTRGESRWSKPRWVPVACVALCLGVLALPAIHVVESVAQIREVGNAISRVLAGADLTAALPEMPASLEHRAVLSIAVCLTLTSGFLFAAGLGPSSAWGAKLAARVREWQARRHRDRAELRFRAAADGLEALPDATAVQQEAVLQRTEALAIARAIALAERPQQSSRQLVERAIAGFQARRCTPRFE